MVSPADSELIAGGSDERRRFMDVVISQYDKEYLDALIRYNKALVQRNTLLKSEHPIEEELFLVWEEMMAQAGEVVSPHDFLNDASKTLHTRHIASRKQMVVLPAGPKGPADLHPGDHLRLA